MEIRFLGTNGWFDTETGNTTCVFINSKNHYIIFDAGNGIYKIWRYIKEQKPVYLFLSHFHLDHIIGLHILNKFHFPAGLVVFGMEGTEQILHMFVNEPFTIPFADYSCPVTIRELSEGTHAVPFPVECRALLHSTPCFGYRIVIHGSTITYCTDTGVCDNAIRLARDADVLNAKKSNAKKLALIHFDADTYKKIKERRSVQKRWKKIFLASLLQQKVKRLSCNYIPKTIENFLALCLECSTR